MRPAHTSACRVAGWTAAAVVGRMGGAAAHAAVQVHGGVQAAGLLQLLYVCKEDTVDLSVSGREGSGIGMKELTCTSSHPP